MSEREWFVKWIGSVQGYPTPFEAWQARAACYQQKMVNAAIAQKRDEPPIRANGQCHWCLAPVGPRQLFCDGDCAEDYDKDRSQR